MQRLYFPDLLMAGARQGLCDLGRSQPRRALGRPREVVSSNNPESGDELPAAGEVKYKAKRRQVAGESLLGLRFVLEPSFR